jgi:hypothetical protein
LDEFTEASGCDSSNFSDSFGSDACDTPDFAGKFSFAAGADCGGGNGLCNGTVGMTAPGAGANEEDAFSTANSRRFSTCSWPMGFQDEAIIATFVEHSVEGY